jgi:hypothetical protein
VVDTNTDPAARSQGSDSSSPVLADPRGMISHTFLEYATSLSEAACQLLQATRQNNLSGARDALAQLVRLGLTLPLCVQM